MGQGKMNYLFDRLEDLKKELEEKLKEQNNNGELSCFAIPYNDDLLFSGNTVMVSDAGYLRILVNELEAKIVQLSTVSINDFVCFFNLFGDSIAIEYKDNCVTLNILSSDGEEHQMATLPFGDISLFSLKDGVLELNGILKDFATDDLIAFAKFYVNFKDTFVSRPFSVFDAAQLYKGLRDSETYILK